MAKRRGAIPGAFVISGVGAAPAGIAKVEHQAVRSNRPSSGGRRNDAHSTTRPKKKRYPARPIRRTSSPAPPGRQGYRIWILVNWDRMLMRNPSSQPARLGWARIPPGRLPTGPNSVSSTGAGIGFLAPPRTQTPQRPRTMQRPSLTAGGRQFTIPPTMPNPLCRAEPTQPCHPRGI